MPVLGVVGCRILEDELVHLLSADLEVRELLLVDGSECLSLSGKLKAQGRPHILLGLEHIAEHLKGRQSRREGIFSRLSNRSARDADLVVVVSLLNSGLHSDLERLKAAVYDNIRRLAAFSDGILIFYGKCGNALADLEDDLTDLSLPLYFLADEHGERIDDCIAVALGGNENYGRILAENQDVALFMTPMWASCWKEMGREGTASGRRKGLGEMLKVSRMRKVARIDTGLCFEPGFEEKVDGFAREFGLQKIDLSGGTKIAERCYAGAKSRLLGVRAGCEPSCGSLRSSRYRCLLETMLALCRKTWMRLLGE